MTIIIFYALLSPSTLKALSGKMIDEKSACVHNLPLNKAPIHTQTFYTLTLTPTWARLGQSLVGAKSFLQQFLVQIE